MLDDHSSFKASIVNDLLARSLKGFLDDLDSMLLVEVFHLNIVQSLGAIQQSSSSSDDNTFLQSTSGGHDGIIESVLDLLDFDLGGSTDLDDSDASTKLGLSLLKFLLIILRGRESHFLSDLVDPGLDGLLITSTVDDDGLILVDDDFLGSTQNSNLDIFEGHSELSVKDL